MISSIGHPQHRRRDFSSGRDGIRLSSAELLLLAVQKKAAGRLDLINPKYMVNGYKLKAGSINDGPIYASIYNKLIGLTLHQPDEFAEFQNEYVVYHDDIGDYSTNEPTMDGTADALLMMAIFGLRAK